MQYKLINIIFFLICFGLIFNNIPKALQMSFWGGPIGDKLVFLPCFFRIMLYIVM